MGVILTILDAFDSLKPEIGMNSLFVLVKGVYTEITVNTVKCVKSDIKAEGVANS